MAKYIVTHSFWKVEAYRDEEAEIEADGFYITNDALVLYTYNLQHGRKAIEAFNSNEWDRVKLVDD